MVLLGAGVAGDGAGGGSAGGGAGVGAGGSGENRHPKSAPSSSYWNCPFSLDHLGYD